MATTVKKEEDQLGYESSYSDDTTYLEDSMTKKDHTAGGPQAQSNELPVRNQDVEYIGKRVAKHCNFGLEDEDDNIFRGTVVKIVMNKGGETKYFTIMYDCGDEEGASKRDLFKMFKVYAKFGEKKAKKAKNNNAQNETSTMDKHLAASDFLKKICLVQKDGILRPAIKFNTFSEFQSAVAKDAKVPDAFRWKIHTVGRNIGSNDKVVYFLGYDDVKVSIVALTDENNNPRCYMSNIHGIKDKVEYKNDAIFQKAYSIAEERVDKAMSCIEQDSHDQDHDSSASTSNKNDIAATHQAAPHDSSLSASERSLVGKMNDGVKYSLGNAEVILLLKSKFGITCVDGKYYLPSQEKPVANSLLNLRKDLQSRGLPKCNTPLSTQEEAGINMWLAGGKNRETNNTPYLEAKLEKQKSTAKYDAFHSNNPEDGTGKKRRCNQDQTDIEKHTPRTNCVDFDNVEDDHGNTVGKSAFDRIRTGRSTNVKKLEYENSLSKFGDNGIDSEKPKSTKRSKNSKKYQGDTADSDEISIGEISPRAAVKKESTDGAELSAISNAMQEARESTNQGSIREHKRQPQPHQCSSPSSSQAILSVLKSKLSHAVTISSHLIYPIYCLKFDKTGRYFITGSDDQVAKVFHLGTGADRTTAMTTTATTTSVGGTTTAAAENNNNNRATSNYGANVRGAVLVCSLRGHAGVVTDIDVSADNALLATASGDGDVRIWGLKDGHPVAILRGHKDGANMVSWSTLTPFRLVTCGEDGMARMWDVHKAVQTRYNGEYYQWLEKEIEDSANQEEESAELKQGHCTNQTLLLSNQVQEVQPRQQQGAGVLEVSYANNPIAVSDSDNNNTIIPPPLILGETNYGDFVANDRMDKGVELIAQFQHDTLLKEGLTRTGRKKVNVMCLTRCPVGGHFATGSDDGVGRIWADEDDWRVEKIDRELSEFDSEDQGTTIHASSSSLFFQSQKAPSTKRLLSNLRGHENSVTDMMYSNAGDRILSASMKDGNVCIWSWDKEGAVGAFGDPSVAGFQSGQVLPKISNVTKLTFQLSPVSQGGPSTAAVHCDGVAWTCDDTKVITSQSSPTKATKSTEIIPDSQMIYVWDSQSGKCHMGIMSSHGSLCSTLSPHPILPSVIASAGADGVVNVWDLDRGDCFFTHTNKLLHGPSDPSANNRGKPCGYLEVKFSPDGLDLVVADESGRVTVLDTHVPARPQSAADSTMTPAWMKEQYFANDYYDLAYNVNGHCIEKGSQQPPHLAPNGVRCTHEGVANSPLIEETFRQLAGPLPLPQNDARWNRDDVRTRSAQVRSESGEVSKESHRKKSTWAKSPDLSRRSGSTAIITKQGKLFHQERKPLALSASSHRNSPGRKSNSSRPLSNKNIWREDISDSDDDIEDPLDEDYEGNGRRLEESSEEEFDDDGIPRARTRSSRRPAHRTYNELHSVDDELEQMMSTHTKISGNFVEDWNESNHFFKMPRDDGDNVRRKWLSRTDYQGSSLGIKTYCPQVGDSVIYIPRAHADTLQKFPIPGYSPPWSSWPSHSSWPVVRCTVTHIRYRFPYEMYYRSRSRDDKMQSVSAVLTLEISGVPSPLSSAGRNFPWPEATFAAPTSSRTRSIDATTFEVTIFECNEEEFIIPTNLYTWRISELEKAITANGGDANGVSVTVYCPPENDDPEVEDTELVGYTGTLCQVIEMTEGEIHFMDSGYNALTLQWDIEYGEDETAVSTFCAWNVIVNNPSCATYVVPAMGDVVKNAVKQSLHTIINMDVGVKEWFQQMVDTRYFSDYLEMVEVPMYLSLIQKRLRSNYYTNKSSVVADMELVRENCYKYNEENNEYYNLACQMYNKFNSLMDVIMEDQSAGIEERVQFCTSKSNTSQKTRSQQRTGEGTDLSSDSRKGPRARTARISSKPSYEEEESEQEESSNEEEKQPAAKKGLGARMKVSYQDKESEEDEESSSEVAEEDEESSSEEETTWRRLAITRQFILKRKRRAG